MTERQVAALERAAAAGAEARSYLDRAAGDCLACGAGTTIFKEREQQIIAEAVEWFRTPAASKDDHVAVRFIAALAEVRDLRKALEYRDRKSAEAKAALYGGETAG